MAKVVAQSVALAALGGVATGEEAKRITTADVSSAASLVQEEQCIVSSTSFQPPMANVSHTMQTSSEACQISCALTPGCAYFSFNKYLMQCNYADASSKPTADYRFVSGRPTCKPGEGAPAVMCKTDYPRDGFPGVTAEQSNDAWPLGRQPKRLECWPKTSEGKPAQCKLTTVIEDTTNGWPGVCWGLKKQDSTSTTRCDEACANDPECASYQIEDDNCYMGVGRECYVRESAKDWKPTRAQRYQHGTVRVLMDLKGWQVTGLSKVFRPKANYFETHEKAADHCKLSCYSDINCQYWIYSTEYGCWMEDVSKFKVHYPLTTEIMTRDSTFAQTAIAGEFVQHICPATTDEELATPGVPFCALSGYKLEPLDLDTAHVENSPDLCQKRCFNTAGCSYFSYEPKTGKCHLEGYNSLMVLDSDYISGPQECPMTTPAPQASCELHPTCTAQGFEGACCPTQDGAIMDCCSQATIAGSLPARSMTITGGGVPVLATEEHSSMYHWWPMIPAILLVGGALSFFFFWARRNTRTKRALLTPMDSPVADKFASDSDAEALLNVNPPMMQGGGFSQQQMLPFPEAGLPNSGMPFPDAGIPYGYHGPVRHSYASYA